MRVFSVCIQAVGIERFSPPGVDAAKAHLVQVHAERDILVALEFPRKLYVGELFGGVMLGVEFQTRVTHDHESLAVVVGEGRPLDIGALACFADFHVHDRHRIHQGRVDAHEASAITAHVVFVGAASKPADFFVALRHRKERTHVRNIALGAVRIEGVFHHDIAAAVNEVGQLHLGATHIGEAEIEGHLGFVGGDFLDFGRHVAFLARLAPFAVALFHIEALVVIGRGTPEVRDTAVLDDGIAIEHVACKRSRILVEANLEILAFEREFAAALSHPVGSHGADIHFGGPELTQVDAELLMANAMARLSPKFVVLQAEIDIQEVFGTDLGFDFRHLDSHFLFLVRADVHLRTVQLTSVDDLAVFPDLPVGIEEVAQVLEEVAVFNFNLALCRIYVFHAKLAVLVLDFPHFGLDLSIREHEAVRAEVVVVLPVAPHAAEFPIRGSLVVQALVDKVPNEAAESARVAVEGVHVFLQVAHGVTHGVLVFAEHHGLVRILVTGDIVVAPIHLACHIGIVVVAFVMHVTGRVNLVGALAFRGEHVTVTGFVPQGPKDNAGVVLVTLHHGIQAVYHRGAPVVAIFRKFAVGAVAFHIRLVNHVDTVLVAKVVHHRIVRVMRHTERVDVETLHQDDVLFHSLVGHSAAVIRVEFVAVHAVEFYRHAVYKQARSPVVLLDFNFSKANFIALDLDYLAATIFNGKHCGIQVRRFGRPAVRFCNRQFKVDTLFALRADAGNLLCRRRNNFGSLVVVQGKFHGILSRGRSCRVINPRGRFQQTVGIIVGKSRIDLEILYVHFGHGVNVHIAHDTRKADKVLVFEPGTVAPAEYLHRDVVLPAAQVLVDIEFVTSKGIFGVTYIVAVHPNIVSGFNAFEVQADTLARPFFGDGEVAAVMAHRVKVCRSVRCRNAVVLRPRINHVGINRMVVTE